MAGEVVQLSLALALCGWSMNAFAHCTRSAVHPEYRRAADQCRKFGHVLTREV
jgi:hypothetical protein